MSTERRVYELKARATAREETRRRIVEATVQLHHEVGPAATTVAEIARRAGVQRLTVYNHFPDDRDLFAACGASWTAAHPPPDARELLRIEDPAARLRAILLAFYAYYRENQQMRAHIERDRLVLPALDAAVSAGMGAQFAALVEAIAGSQGLTGARQKRFQAMLSLALDFWTWHHLSEEGLSDREAADTMVAAVAGVLGPGGK